jgi:hypothetical protein
MANSRDIVSDVGAMDRAAVPGMGSSEEDGVGAMIIGSNGNGFVQETVEVFNANGFAIAASSDMTVNLQNRASDLLFKKAFENAAAAIDNN